MRRGGAELSIQIRPTTLRFANEIVRQNHRHHGSTRGHKFSIAATSGGEVVGIAIVGRPVSRMLDDGETAEVTRLCTDGYRNACSKLYSSCWRACRAMGYAHCITYILGSESGTSLKASGWRFVKVVPGRSWDRKERHREDKHPTCDKQLWAIGDPLGMEAN